MAMTLIIAVGYLVYAGASSDRFRVRSVQIEGAGLLTRAEIESTAPVMGLNIFWLNRAELVNRLQALPVVRQVDVTTWLPDTVEIHIVEREPSAFWMSGNQTYLVDGEGIILKPVDAETAQIRACAGQPCDPRLVALPTVSQVQGQPLSPGDRVDANALRSSARLASLLPSLGIHPLNFEWSPDTGLEVPTSEGWRARFDDATNLDSQVATLRSIRDYLARSKISAQLVDVRFDDRPYYR